MAKTMRIAAMSVSAPEIEQIKSMIASLRGDAGASWEWTADSNQADVLIIDADSMYGHMDWLRAQSSGRNVICLTASSGHDQDNVLHRPLGVGGLKASLARAAGGGVAADTAAPATDAPAPQPTPAAQATFFDPGPAPVAVAAPVATAAPTPAPVAAKPAAASTPIGSGLTAPSLLPKRQTGQQPVVPAAPTLAPTAPVAAPAAIPAPVPAPAAVAAPTAPRELTLADYILPENLADARKLERDGHPPLIVDAAADRYYGGLTLKPLLPYCSGTIKAQEWHTVPSVEIDKLRAMNAGLPLSRLLWLYVIGTSNGTTLLPGFDLNAKFKLVKWPQIEREFPKHFRIGTAMMKGPSTLSEIADGSGANVGEVIDFVNAYAAIGFAVQDGGTPISDRRAVIERLRSRAV